MLHIIAAIMVVAGFVYGVSLVVKPAFAQDVTLDAARPGAKEDDGDNQRPAGPLPYPDLSKCAAIKDGSLYRGEDRVMKFIHVGTAGWLYRSLDFRMDYTMPEKTMNYMKRVNEALKAKGVDLYVVLQPSRAMVVPGHIDPNDVQEGYDPKVAKRNYQALISELQSNGIQTTDLSNPPNDFEYFFRGDPHWRREGSMWTAKQMASLILQNQFFNGREPEKFSNEITWWLESEKGEFDEFVDKFCGVDIPPERRPMWATTALAGEASEASLFGDVTYPGIAIVGTSNTAHEQDFNFVGSLKQELSADIRNKAVAAGGFAGSSLLFYASDEFHEHTPKIVIWEFLSHHIFDDYIGFRQMLPAIYGACSEQEALAVATTKIVPPVGYVDPNFIGPMQPVAVDPAAAVPAVAPVVPVAGGVVDPNAPVMLAATMDEYGPPLPSTAKKKNRLSEEMHESLVFENLDTKAISPQDSYLYIEVTAPESRLLEIGVLYANGDAEEIDVSRSRRAENNGKYYLEFNPDFVDPVVMVQIETDKPQGDVKARICKYKNEKQ